MRQNNVEFTKLVPGDILQVRPDLYDRELTDAVVESVTFTTLKNGFRRNEIFVKILDRKNYSTLIMDVKDTNLSGT